MKLSKISKPFVCAVIAEADAKHCLNQIDKTERVVDAYEINLTPLNRREIGDIFASTCRPCIASFRRSDFMKLYGYRKLTELTRSSWLPSR